jgi:putative addiction module killer protein
VEAKRRLLLWYRTASDTEPGLEWLRNFSNCEPVGNGVHELKIDFGPGFRVYFGEDGDSVILLNGGNKDTQDRDIKKAKEYWEDYNA